MGAAFERSPSRGGADLLEAERSGSLADAGDPHLRSLTAVVGYHIEAEDGPIGHVENFLVDGATWGIGYLIIETKNWWPGQHVLMSPSAVCEISWSERGVTLRVTRDQVRNSPAWDAAEIIDEDYEKRLHGHYGWQRHNR